MKNQSLMLSFLLYVLCQTILASPAQVILIRHGEKPKDGNELSDQGQERAQELVPFFLTDPRVTRFGYPVAIYAMAPSSEDGSVRAIQTMIPLATKLNMTIRVDYTKKQGDKLTSDIMNLLEYDGKMVLICWEHKALLDIVMEFGVTTPPAPADWPGNIYNWALIIDFDKFNKIADFQNITQNLPMDL